MTKNISELIDISQAEKVIDSYLIENLLQMDNDQQTFEILSFSSPRFEPSLYVERKMAMPPIGDMLNELARQFNCSIAVLNEEKCKVGPNGKIQWIVKDGVQLKKTWDKMKILLEGKSSSNNSSSSNISEEELIDTNNKRVIITGVAGTGKSTILSYYYERIKRTKSDWWVIKIDLVDYSDAMSNIDFSDAKPENAIAMEFFINCPALGMDQSPFARSLFRHRLETGDRIVFILDGFDEIGSDCQDRFIQLVRNLKETIPVYITTRPHRAIQLQFELSQLAYTIIQFTEDNQINYLTTIWMLSIWKNILNTPNGNIFEDYLTNSGNHVLETLEEKQSSIWKKDIKNSIKDVNLLLKDFAKALIKRVLETLNDQERALIGVPLQCRILAECSSQRYWE